MRGAASVQGAGWVARLEGDPRAAWALAAGAAALGGAWAAEGRFLHDEGLLAWCFARMVSDAPAAVLFWQKSRPALALAQAPVAALGAEAHAIAHAVIGALAIPLVAATARALGQRAPNVAGAVVACSPLWLAAGAAGVSNSDALTGLALALYLWLARGRPALAGLVLGALLLVRSELAVFVGGLGLWALARGPRRLAVAATAAPAAYGLAGAIYHRDLLWMLRFPPALPSPPPESPLFGPGGYGAGLEATALALLALSPALVLGGVDPRRLPAIERLLFGLGVIYVAAIRGLPALGVFNFDDSPRYLLPCLPALALGIARGVEGWPSGQDHGGWTIAGLGAWLAAGLAVAEAGGSAAPLAAVAAAAAGLVAARAGAGRAALGGLGIAVAAGALALLPATRLGLAEGRPELAEIAGWLAAHPEATAAVPVVTNVAVLKARLGAEAPEILYLLGADQDHEIEALTDAAVGQTAAVRAAMARRFYAGAPVRPSEVEGRLAGRAALFVLAEDPRLGQSLPAARWWPRLTEEARVGRVTIARQAPTPEGGR